MSLKIIAPSCQIAEDRARGVIVIESDCGGPPFQDSFTELDSQDARRIAQGYAAQLGIAPAHINGNIIGPYPVNLEGLSLENVRDEGGNPLPPQHPRMQPKAYRIDVPVCRPLR